MTKPMQTELRPFSDGSREGLDEIVADNVSVFHAEMMGDASLWIGISDDSGGLVHVWITAEKRKGRTVLVMRAEDQDRPTIVDCLDRLKRPLALGTDAR